MNASLRQDEKWLNFIMQEACGLLGHLITKLHQCTCFSIHPLHMLVYPHHVVFSSSSYGISSINFIWQHWQVSKACERLSKACDWGQVLKSLGYGKLMVQPSKLSLWNFVAWTLEPGHSTLQLLQIRRTSQPHHVPWLRSLNDSCNAWSTGWITAAQFEGLESIETSAAVDLPFRTQERSNKRTGCIGVL